MKTFALAGNPNCGKTTLFNNLTGASAHVGNWPGVTVDKREGVYKKAEEPLAIMDLPGIYSLSPYTAEEVISRNFLLDEKPSCIINIVDATNLERNLYLTTQLMEIDVPIVVAVNMMDVLEKRGDKLDLIRLERNLGVPVVPISALKNTGLDELMTKAYEASKNTRQGSTVLKNTYLTHLISDCKIALEGQNVDNSLFHAVKLVELDEIEVAAHPSSAVMVEKFKVTHKDEVFDNDYEAMVADARYKYITSRLSTALTRAKGDSITEYDASTKADKILTHRIWGFPIFILILFAIFHLTFSENLLWLGSGKGPLNEWVSLEGTVAEGLFGSNGLASPGVFLQNLLTWGTDSLNGLINMGLTNVGAPDWTIGLVCDGILGGIFSVLSFLPQILLLFLLFSILEDSGYMARIAFILDKPLRKFGLTGRAFLPMIMGFGCSVPAMINTRTLADDKEKLATIRVIPFFSCGAKLPILTAIAGAIGTSFGLPNTDLITYGMYLLGIIVAVVMVMVMRKTTLKGELPPFIMELPLYHMPGVKNIAKLLWDKAEHFIKKAFTIILASTIVIWFVSHFSWDWHYIEDEQINESILAGIGKLLQPILTPLGFGSQLTNYGWVFVVCAITGLIAKENCIATFGTLAGCIISGFQVNEALEGVDSVATMIQATGITVPALIAFIAFNMLTIPCFAAVATAKGEIPTKRQFNFTMLFWILVSYFVSAMIYVIGSWWWTAFIFGAVLAAGFVVLTLIEKGKIRRIK